MPEMDHGADLPPENPSGGLNLNDIYFILFRRKWIIILFGILGIATAAVLYLLDKPVYRSDAKLLVRYIVEDKPLMPGDQTQVKNIESGGSTIINSEIQILTSVDLLTEVAEAVGPSKILDDVDEQADKFVGAAAIAERLKVEVPTRSDIIQITFRHRDPALVKPVLDRLIGEYLKRHAEIHRGGSSDVSLSQHADELRSKLNATDEELRKLKAEAGVSSLEETKTARIQEMSSLRQELFNTEASLAEARAALSIGTNTVASTNGAQASAEIPADVITQYRATMVHLTAERDREFQIRSQFSNENPLVKRARERVAEVEQQRNAWETQYPGLVKLANSAGPATAPSGSPLENDATRVTALEAKARTLKAQLESIRLEMGKLDGIEGRLKQLQSRRDLDETNYRYFAASLDRSRFDQTLGLTRNNIGVVQSPTPATKDDSKLLKLLAAAVGGGFGFGLALAFLLEMFVDQSVRQVHDVDRRLRLPLFMSVPYVNGRVMRRLAKAAQKRLAAGGQDHADNASAPAVASAPDHPLRPVFESLRDRTLLHLKHVDHKPKLIGITSCSVGAGGTTFAAGLAATLSETGEGKVLLVDMHQPKGVAHPFFQGRHVSEIGDVLEEDKRAAAMVQENLYVAAANAHDRKMGALAKQLSTLVPRFRASDYDFIIFDMPRVSETSVSVRLAAMMDLALLVVESEKSPRRAVKQAHSLLADTGVDTQVVLNKLRSYVPAGLSGEL